MPVKRRTAKYPLLRFLLPALILVLSLSGTAYAYMKATYRFQGSTTVGINLLFDTLSQEGFQKYGNGQSFSREELQYGHIGNPYVISNLRHIQNLSFLQKRNFFQNPFPKLGKDAVGPYAPADLPCFLVCTPDYEPVLIDGGGTVIDPIGTEDCPFIGTIRGVSGSADPHTSTIRGFQVRADQDQIDVGFFGTISCLGRIEPSDQGNTFLGIPSELHNLVFSDIQLVVENSAWDDFLRQIHRFVGSILQTDTGLSDPEETHHLGLIAGHIEYSSASDLSVYYSSPEICAISLRDTSLHGEKPMNYLSGCGFFGLMYHLDPEASNGEISIQGGIDNGSFSEGLAGGGGMLDGTYPGYIRADEFYRYCQEHDAAQGDSAILKQVARQTEVNGKPYYYFEDSVFSFVLSPDQENPDTIEALWPDQVRSVFLPVQEETGSAPTESPGETEENQARETQVPETQVQETQAQETQNPETQIPETQAQEAQVQETGVMTSAAPAAIPAADPENTMETASEETTEAAAETTTETTETTAATTEAVTEETTEATTEATVEESTAATEETIEETTAETTEETIPLFQLLEPYAWEGPGWDPSRPPIYEDQGSSGIRPMVLAPMESWHIREQTPEGRCYIQFTKVTDLKTLQNSPNGAFVILPYHGSSSDHYRHYLYLLSEQRTPLAPLMSQDAFQGYPEAPVQAEFAGSRARSQGFQAMALQIFYDSGNYYIRQQEPGSSRFRNLAITSNGWWSTLEIKEEPFPLKILKDTRNPSAFHIKGKRDYLNYDNNDMSLSAGEKYPFCIYQVTGYSSDESTQYRWCADAPAAELDPREYVLMPETDPEFPHYERGNHVYTLKALSELNWKMSTGDALSETTIPRHYFHIQQKIDWAGSFGGGAVTSGAVKIPIGPDRKEAWMPAGTLAFLCQSPGPRSFARMVIKLPETQEVFSSRSQNPKFGTYLNAQAADRVFFEESNFQYHYSYIPLVQPRLDKKTYEACSPAERAQYEIRQREAAGITVRYQGQTYTTFLEQGTYLLAAEYHPKADGVYYVLLTQKQPMQLVYCAVSDLASKGDDGTRGSPLQNIDFVYSSNGTVFPVTQKGPSVRDPYQGYYPSNRILQFDNWGKVTGIRDPRIHQVEIYLCRSIRDGSTGLETHFSGENAPSILLTQYGSPPDQIWPRS